MLDGVTILKQVPEAVVADIGRRCRYLDLDEGEVLVEAGDATDKVYFLLAGELRFSVYTRVGKVVSLRGADLGAFVGEAALADDGRSPYSVEAARPSTVAALNAQTFMEFVHGDASLLRALLGQFFERQVLLTEQIVELSTLSVHARIHKELVRLSRENMKADGSSIIRPVPTHSELARRIGTQREAVSRQMSHLQQLGIIVRREGGLFIPYVSRLIELQMMLEV